MVLGSDEALGGTDALHGLVMGTMSVFQLVSLGTCRLGQELVAETDTHTRPHCLIVQEGADMLHRLTALLRVARTIGQEEPIEV